MSTVTDFLTARLDEWDENFACAGSGEYSSCDEWSERHERLIPAMRKIVERITEGCGHPWISEDGLTRRYLGGWCDHCDLTLRDFASIWQDHADFREEWRA